MVSLSIPFWLTWKVYFFLFWSVQPYSNLYYIKLYFPHFYSTIQGSWIGPFGCLDLSDPGLSPGSLISLWWPLIVLFFSRLKFKESFISCPLVWGLQLALNFKVSFFAPGPLNLGPCNSDLQSIPRQGVVKSYETNVFVIYLFISWCIRCVYNMKA